MDVSLTIADMLPNALRCEGHSRRWSTGIRYALEQIELWTFLLLLLTSIVVGISKSGLLVTLGAINVPLLTLVMSARDAAGLLLTVMLVVDFIAIVLYARQLDRGILAIMVPGCILGVQSRHLVDRI